MGFLDFMTGKDAQTQQFNKYSPDQQNSLNSMLGGAQEQMPQIFELLKNILGGDPESMKAFSDPARTSFEQNTLPSIAERFSSMNAQNSSAFGQQLGAAGANLEENLAGQRANLQSGAMNQLMNMFNTGMTHKMKLYIPSYWRVFRWNGGRNWSRTWNAGAAALPPGLSALMKYLVGVKNGTDT